MDKLNTKTQGDIPAKDTLEYMRINNNNMAEIKLKVELLEQAVKNFSQKADDADDRNCRQHEEIIKMLREHENKFAEKEEFNFWRNVLISGILISIFLGIIGLILKGIS
jgi:hypothetical protein